ncbi:hypothetical protein SBBP2_1040001 [Burkholderiales bacterium]|nr:hypothetical protein SBBP2_1040001 [Burkholderiales bacterium]
MAIGAWLKLRVAQGKPVPTGEMPRTEQLIGSGAAKLSFPRGPITRRRASFRGYAPPLAAQVDVHLADTNALGR